jgi:hypothetical protein
MNSIDFIIENGQLLEVGITWVMVDKFPYCLGVVHFVSALGSEHHGRVEFRMQGEDTRSMLSSLNHQVMWCCENGFLEEETRGQLRCTKRLEGNWMCIGGRWEMFDKDKDEWVQRDPWEAR